MSSIVPIVRYPMNSLSTLGTNSEGSSFNATPSNITIVTDATYGDVAYFSGNGTSSIDMDTIPTSTLVGNASRTISFWANFDTTANNRNVYSQGNLASGQGNFAQVKIGYRGTNVRVEYGNSGGHKKFETSLAAGTWYFFTNTYDGTASRIYWQGSLVLTHTINLNTEAGFVNLGNTYSNGSDFAGKMLDFRIYDVALDATEIASLFSESPVPPPSLNVTMHPHIADLSWGTVDGASSYTVTLSENSGREIVAGITTSTELVIYNLENNSSYDFKLYTDLDPVVSAAESIGNATPILANGSIV